MAHSGRRKLLLALGASAFGSAWHALGQSTRQYRVGRLSTSAQGLKDPYSLAFVERLAELGFVEGKNLVLEARHADGTSEKLPAAAAALSRLKCDVYFASGSEAALAAVTQADRTTPIVFVAVDFDPVATGDVASLARPGGRLTGLTAQQSVLPAKRLELLKEMMPGLSKVAVLANEQTSGQLALVQGTARRMGIALHVLDLKKPPFDLEAAFADAARVKSDAMFVLGSALWVPSRKKIPELALKSRLPSVMHHSQWVDDGGLMSYGFNFPSLFRRAAEMVVMVLKGGKPAEIPMEQPTNYELAVNLKTAKALGIAIPQNFLVRADKVIR